MRWNSESALTRPPAVRALLAVLVALAIVVLAAGGTATADTLFSDGFESGNFSAWSQVQTGGDGTAVVQSSIVRTGALAAQLSENARPPGRRPMCERCLPPRSRT